MFLKISMNKVLVIFYLITVFNIVNVYAENQWEPVRLNFTSSTTIPWYDFPLQVTFTHQESDTQITLDGYWEGGTSWSVRFAPPQGGTWSWESSSSDNELNNLSGSITCTTPTATDLSNNPNLHGQVNVSGNGRYLEYADGTPFFWIADTNWSLSSDKCGVNNGNFYTYIDDRAAKKFTAIQMKYFSLGQYNEGGNAFPDNINDAGDWDAINPEYFQYVDTRMDYMFEKGFVIGAHPEWLSQKKITLTWAQRVFRYLMARYGAYNTVWSLSGEYQFSRDTADSLNCPSEWTSLGNYIQTINPYNRPLTIHPTYGGPEYQNLDFDDYSSSGDFHTQSWLDVNWIQSWSYVEDVSESIYADYSKTPAKPTFMAESKYELSHPDSSHHQAYDVIDSYLIRLQAWSSLLCGAAGYTYGCDGVWQFYEPSHPQSGSASQDGQAWDEAISAEGAFQMQHIYDFFTSTNFDWEKLVPCRDILRVNGRAPSWPSVGDFSPPHCMAETGKIYIVYIPEGNSRNTIEITSLNNGTYEASWFNPRNGSYTVVGDGPDGVDQWTLPSRPDRRDWVLLLADSGASSDTDTDTTIVIDNLDSSFTTTGVWKESTASSGYNGVSVYADSENGNDGATARWTPDISTPGTYNVYAWWTTAGIRAVDAPYTISSNGGTDTVRVNQQQNAGQWNLLGTYEFDAGSGGYVEITRQADNKSTSADAIMFEPVELAAVDTYLSDLTWSSASSGWTSHPVPGLDRSIEGNALTLNGTTYSKGIGTHATSEIVYDIGGNYERFISTVGVDDEMDGQSSASVVFEVYADGTKLYESEIMNCNTATETVDIDVSGVNELKLMVIDAGDGIRCDHADWADARLTKSALNSDPN